MKKRYSDEQIIGFLREADSGVSVKDLCRRYGFSEAGGLTPAAYAKQLAEKSVTVTTGL